MAPRHDDDTPTLTAADVRTLRALMVEVAAETAARHQCRFASVVDADAAEMGHAVGMICDVGEGKLRAGIEVMRENHKWASRLRDRYDKVGVAVVIGVAGVLATGTIGALVVGLRHYITKGAP